MEIDPLAARAAAGLVDCLRVQGRTSEAVALAATHGGKSPAAALAAASARAFLACGDIPGGVRAARSALELATTANSVSDRARAHAVLAQALAAAGCADEAAASVRAGLELAAAAHLPIDALRLRIVELDTCADDPPRRALLVRRLNASQRAQVPRLLRHEARAACAHASGQKPDEETRDYLRLSGAAGIMKRYEGTHGAVAELESLMVLSHGAANDVEALERVCDALAAHLRCVTVIVTVAPPESRVLASAGRAWPGEPHVAHRVVASGVGAPPDPMSEPAQAAEPIRYGPEIIAALACRWAPGALVDRDRASSLLRMGALALAPNVRAILDRAAPAGPAAATGEILGDSTCARLLREGVARAARAPFPVLIEGESGTGKELVARAIHRLGARRERRFCPLNCAALSDDLLEAELFGHARGAFTGAVGERAGLFEEADGGTLFLDEIGELSPRAQAKLLRVLQDGEVRRVGENVARRVDVRIVAATNRRLADEAAAGRFRADLRFRLDVVRIDVPPLRNRSTDVPGLALHFWGDATTRVGSRATLAPDVLAALARYDWPGNVRELQNVIAWMAVHSPRRGRVGTTDLPAHLAQAAIPTGGTFEAAREEFERRFVRAALATANGRRAPAAAALGVSRQGLAKMMRRLGIANP
jgi:DNA-binding NtrC family response regulator